MWVGVVLSAGFTALRTFYQYRSNRTFYSNDYLILLAMLFHLLSAAVYQVALPPMYELALVGAGILPVTENFAPNANFFLRLQFAVDYLLWTTTWLVKFSLLLFFWRLFDSVQSPMRIFWWIMCGITAATYITTLVIQLFACDPISNFFIIGESACFLYETEI